MRTVLIKLSILFFLFFIIVSAIFKKEPAQEVLDQYRSNTLLISKSFNNLSDALDGLSKEAFIDSLMHLRNEIKYSEVIFGSFDSYFYNEIFAPNIDRAYYENGEQPLIKDRIGLQRIEEITEADFHRVKIKQELHKISYLIRSMLRYSKELSLNDEHIFWAAKNELIRIQTMGISGFDTPVYSNSLKESATALNGLKDYLDPYKQRSNDPAFFGLLQKCIDYLNSNNDNFNEFDRLEFIREYMQPAWKGLLNLQKELNISNLKTENVNAFAVNQRSSSIFENDFLNPYFFHESRLASPGLEMEELGRLLFFDPILSGNNSVSCSSCHKPEFAFADNVKISKLHTRTVALSRNAPTLLNSSFQHTFQLEGIATSMEQQMHLVIFNPDEMGSTENNIIENLNASEEYAAMFRKVFEEGKPINFSQVKYAIGAYIRSLVALDSPFDAYMRSESSTIDSAVKNGFNLFMGKAACATCHFPPVFNGTVPPLYAETELEVIGVTENENLENPVLDKDPGAFLNGQVLFHKHAFKTPTIRNVDITAPYMHNGGFGSLEKVMEFYNEGGAVGLGIPLENQTLSSDPLLLSQKEISDIISFMKSLNDFKKFKPIGN